MTLSKTRLARSLPLRCGLLAALIGAGGRGLTGAEPVDPFFYEPVESMIRFSNDGNQQVMIMLAARESGAEKVRMALQGVGADIRYQELKIGYFRAVVSRGAVEKILQSGAVEALNFDLGHFAGLAPPAAGSTAGLMSYPPAGFDSIRPTEKVSWPAGALRQGAWAEDPFNRPYSPLGDMNAFEWRRDHPTYDGRGVVVAHQEEPADLCAAELSGATSIEGRLLPKYLDYVLTTSPREELAGLEAWKDRRWVAMTPVAAPEAVFRAGEALWVAPRPGRFWFGEFEAGGTLLRSLDPGQAVSDLRQAIASRASGEQSGRFHYGILWDKNSGEVWLDTNRDGKFADEKALHDFRRQQEFGILGRDDPATRNRETVSFVVQTSAETNHVAILPGLYGHATMVASSLAGSRRNGGHFDGIAPGAQLLARSGAFDAGSAGQALEGTIEAFLDPRVDLVMAQDNFYYNKTVQRSAAGRAVHNVIIGRLIGLTGKPFVGPAGNNGRDADVECLALAPWAFTAGAGQGRDSYWTNYGLRVPDRYNLHKIGAFGPGDDGSVQPTLLVPVAYLSSHPPSAARNAYSNAVDMLYQLPPGYEIGGGTSQAAPTLAGILALLISAAKQEHVPYNAPLLWLALTNSTRYVSNLPAHQQGNGFVDVAAAFALLKAYHGTMPPRVASEAPVCADWSRDLAIPGVGVSLFEESGWHPGSTGTRRIFLTRTSGPVAPLTCRLHWNGNDGSFRGPPSVELPLNVPTALTVEIETKTSGYHSALLDLDHDAVPGHVHRLMIAVIANESFIESRDYVVRFKQEVDRPTPTAPFFLELPRHVQSLVVEMRGGRSDGAFFLVPPSRAETIWRWAARPIDRFAAVDHPVSGPWVLSAPLYRRDDSYLDLRWTNATERPDPPSHVEFTASLLGADVELKSPAPDSATAVVRNRFGPFEGRVVSTGLGAGRRLRGHLAPRQLASYEFEVPKGADFLQVNLPECSAPTAVDVSLAREDGDGFQLVAQADGPSAERTLRVRQPEAGKWKVALAATHAPDKGVDYVYEELVVDPALGGVIAVNVPQHRSLRAEWNVPLHVWRSPIPLPADRQLYLPVLVEATWKDKTLLVGFEAQPWPTVVDRDPKGSPNTQSEPGNTSK